MFLLNNPIEVNNHKAIGWSLYKYTKNLKKNKMSLHSFPKRGCDGSQLPRVSKKDLYSYKKRNQMEELEYLLVKASALEIFERLRRFRDNNIL